MEISHRSAAMIALAATDRIRRVLCLGAHSDDIEIGCGGTLLKLARESRQRGQGLIVRWIVFSADAAREAEARRSADLFLADASSKEVIVHHFRDGFFPFVAAQVKEAFEAMKSQFVPDVIFTHTRDDLHQDHALLANLTWNTFRDHLVMEYEVPKYDGDLGRPNAFVPLDRATCDAKITHLMDCFESQRGKQWFTEETFRAMLRLRGLECNAPGKYAEAFYSRKFTL
jgi:LmbE family N-acetylglucosaminyl deacetylase